MHRRRFLRLAALGTGAGTCPLAGCSSARPEPETTPPTRSTTATAGTDPETTANGPRGCPPAPEWEDVPVHCGAVGRIEATAPSSTLAMPRDALRVTLHNRSDAALTPAGIRFYRWLDGEWVPIRPKEPDGATGPRTGTGTATDPAEIPAGGRRRWDVRLDTATLSGSSTVDLRVRTPLLHLCDIGWFSWHVQDGGRVSRTCRFHIQPA